MTEGLLPPEAAALTEPGIGDARPAVSRQRAGALARHSRRRRRGLRRDPHRGDAGRLSRRSRAHAGDDRGALCRDRRPRAAAPSKTPSRRHSNSSPPPPRRRASQRRNRSWTMREAVIVSTARTPIGKAYRGAFNDTPAQTLGGHAIGAAVGRAGVAGAEIDDVVMGAALQQGSTGVQRRAPMRVARGAADQRRRHVGRPAMRLGPDGDRHRRQADRRRRHAASRSAAAWNRSRWCRTTT